ncbi:hypothetical protein LguiA_025551 [Lonicera macranthoides]
MLKQAIELSSSIGSSSYPYQELNRNGEVYIESYPKLKVNVVDGSSLVAAIVINN